jgi:threonine aldolase
VAAAVRPAHDWEPRSSLVCLENTVNRTGGAVYTAETIHDVAGVAREYGLALHLDGARLWNAAVTTGSSEAELAAPFDTVSVSLSKALGAPVGSVLAGSTDTIRRARRLRKMLGGGMRQIGVLAAAGLYALEHHRTGLAADHAKARRLAETVASLPDFDLDASLVETNIVLFESRRLTAAHVLRRLEERGIGMVAFGPNTLRAVTHRDVSDEDIETAANVLKELFCE